MLGAGQFFELCIIVDALPFEIHFIVVYLDNNNCPPSFLRPLCENWRRLFLGRGIFLREHSSRRKIPRTKQSPTNSHEDRKIDGAKLLLSLITNTLTISHVLCVFFDKNTKKTAFFIISVLNHVNKFQSADVTIIARCDKCANTGCIARDCLCVYAYARMALAIMPTSHAEVIVRSHCYVIMTAQFFLRQVGNNLRGLDRAIKQVINHG